MTGTKIFLERTVKKHCVPLSHSDYIADELNFLTYFTENNDMKITGTIDMEHHEFLTSALYVIGFKQRPVSPH
jgi:hypothetical protein